MKITHNLQDRKIHSREDRNQVTRLRNTKTEVKKIEARERSYYSHYKGSQDWYKLATSYPSVTATLPQPKEDENSTTYTETNIVTTRKSFNLSTIKSALPKLEENYGIIYKQVCPPEAGGELRKSSHTWNSTNPTAYREESRLKIQDRRLVLQQLLGVSAFNVSLLEWCRHKISLSIQLPSLSHNKIKSLGEPNSYFSLQILPRQLFTIFPVSVPNRVQYYFLSSAPKEPYLQVSLKYSSSHHRSHFKYFPNQTQPLSFGYLTTFTVSKKNTQNSSRKHHPITPIIFALI